MISDHLKVSIIFLCRLEAFEEDETPTEIFGFYILPVLLVLLLAAIILIVAFCNRFVIAIHVNSMYIVKRQPSWLALVLNSRGAFSRNRGPSPPIQFTYSFWLTQTYNCCNFPKEGRAASVVLLMPIFVFQEEFIFRRKANPLNVSGSESSASWNTNSADLEVDAYSLYWSGGWSIFSLLIWRLIHLYSLLIWRMIHLYFSLIWRFCICILYWSGGWCICILSFLRSGYSSLLFLICCFSLSLAHLPPLLFNIFGFWYWLSFQVGKAEGKMIKDFSDWKVWPASWLENMPL